MPRHLGPLLFAVCALTLTSSAHAGSKSKCDDAMSTVELNECADEEYVAADKELNQVYLGILAGLSSDLKSKDDVTRENAIETKKRLVESERAWITFREKNSALQGIQMLGGSGESLVVSGTMTSMTKARIAELRELMTEQK